MDTWFYRNPRGFALAILVILSMGASAWVTIGKQEDPTITNLFASVLTRYPGADPARVEALVTVKIEEELREIAEVAEISSVSRTGISIIRIELAETLDDAAIESAWTDVRNALRDARREMPAGVPEPDFREEGGGAFTVIAALIPVEGRDASPVLLTRLAEDLQDRLRAIPGTDEVETIGEADEEVRVEVDADLLASLGLRVADVSAAIARADAKMSAGRVEGAAGGADMVVELAGQFRDEARIRDIPIASGASGAILRLGDVARVTRAAEDPPESLVLIEGRRGVIVAARMEADLQVDQWAARVRDALAGFEAALPAGVEQRLVFDQSVYTRARFAELGANIGVGVGLVAVVLFATLGWRAALVVAVALPLSGLISIYMMRQVGISLHQMSVTGMIVALGLLVDAAIVMTDELRQRIAAGMDRLDAVRDAVRRLTVPLLASTLTTVLAFAPMALLPGPVGDFVGSIALSVIIMLVASLVLSLTLTPALAGWLLAAPKAGEAPRWWRTGLTAPRLGRAFAGSLALSLRHPWLSVLAGLALPVMGFLAFPTLTAQFFPGADRDQFHVQVTLGGAPSLGRTEAAAHEAAAILDGVEGIREVTWVVGESAPAFYYNMSMNQDGAPGFAEALVVTASPQATAAIIPALQARLDAALPQAQVIVRDLVQGPPVAAPVELRVVGPDPEVLRAVGERLRGLMSRTPGIVQSRAASTGGAPKLVFDLDEDRVRRAGLTLGAVADDLAAGLSGATGGSLVEGTEEAPVRVRLTGEARGAVDAVAALSTLGPDPAAAMADGRFPGIPLAVLGEARLAPAEGPINRLDGERINLVQGFVAVGTLPETSLAALRRQIEAEADLIPPGYRLEIGGDADARSDTVTNLIATVGLVVVLTIATLTLSLRSFRLTGVALLVCVLAMGLGILSLAVLRHPFGINALIGLIGSIGVSVNAAIILLTGLHENADARAGDRGAMRAVVLGSSRHIVSTTITTFGGFLPLLMAGGGFWPPFAAAVAGGVLLSTVVSFYLVPPLYLLTMAPRARPAPAPEPHPETAALATPGPQAVVG